MDTKKVYQLHKDVVVFFKDVPLPNDHFEGQNGSI